MFPYCGGLNGDDPYPAEDAYDETPDFDYSGFRSKSHKNELVEFCNVRDIHRETPKAYYVYHHNLGMHWIPRSQVTKTEHVISIPRWLYDTKVKDKNNLKPDDLPKDKYTSSNPNINMYNSALTDEEMHRMFISKFGDDYHKFVR
ncbi:hypothetical protein [Vibrio phage Va2]|nr:hypothetical protein [Vibrio phage Va2]